MKKKSQQCTIFIVDVVHRKMKDLLIKSFDKKGGKIVDGKPQNSNFDAIYYIVMGPSPNSLL